MSHRVAGVCGAIERVPQPATGHARLKDVPEAQNYRDDNEFARYLRHIPQPFAQADAERFVAINMAGSWREYPTFAIEHNDKLIGTVILKIDAIAQAAMLGYAISRDQWGKGIAAEAARAVLSSGFESFEISKIWASTDSRHPQSLRVLEKLGMRIAETLFNHHVDRDGQSVDEVVYEILRYEWNSAPPPRRKRNPGSGSVLI